MSISLIRAQNPQGVVTDGYILSLKAKELDELIGVQVRALRQLDGTWQGRAANAARNRAYRDIQRQHLLHEVMAAFADAMQSGGAQLVKIREVLLAWVDAASAMFDVSDAGVVTDEATEQHRADSYPMPEYASVSCTGPRPDKGPGDWQIRAERNEVATINEASPPENPDYHEPAPPALPARSVIRYLGDIVCGVDDNGMTACRVGEHGFILTPTSTTLF